MFKVTNVDHKLLSWVSVELKAEADMALTAQRLRPGYGLPRFFVLETRVLRVEAGQRFIIKARKTDGFWIGERVPLERVANKRPISRNWRTIETA